MIDIHTHILYGVDDGAKKLADSIDLLEEAEKAGFTKIIFSSHYMEGYFTVDSEERKKVLAEISDTNTSNVDIYIGNEIFISNNIINLLKDGKAVSLNESRYVLFELPFNIKPINLMEIVFKLQSNNYVPILAHPERYSYFYRTPEVYEDLVENGVLLQLNFGSFDGQYGRRAKIMAEKLLKCNLAHFIATDVHRTNTLYSAVPRIVDYLKKLVGEEKVKQITEINPGLVIDDKEIEIEEYDEIKYSFFEKLKMKEK